MATCHDAWQLLHCAHVMRLAVCKDAAKTMKPQLLHRSCSTEQVASHTACTMQAFVRVNGAHATAKVCLGAGVKCENATS